MTYRGIGLPGNVRNIDKCGPDPNGADSSICEGKDYECKKRSTRRIQGETDSFGCEYFYLCEECYAVYLQEVEKESEETSTCQWCKKQAVVSPTRDYTEGDHGPVYYVCAKCSAKQYQEMCEE